MNFTRMDTVNELGEEEARLYDTSGERGERSRPAVLRGVGAIAA